MDLKSLLNSAGPVSVNEVQAKQLLRQYDIPMTQECMVDGPQQAVEAARAIGYPVVLKGVGATLQHKTEMGLVHLHLNDDPAVRQAAEQIQARGGDRLEGLLVQPYIHGQRELMTGLFRDPQFGPVVLLGLGGVLAEGLDDVVLGLAPLTRPHALDMVGSLRAQKLLADFRGEQAVQIERLVRILTGLSRLAADHPEIAEVDINPLRITPEGMPRAVDALVVLQSPAAAAEDKPPVSPEEIGRLFSPRSIAFVGASATLGKWGHMLPANTIGGGFQGQVYLVNPKGGTIMGRKVYKRLADIPGTVDLAVVTLPAEKVIGLLSECRDNGIRYMVLISSGFGETGPGGKTLEQQLVNAARQAGVLILGPNTMGIANPHISLYCTGSTVTPVAGRTTMVSQSGNMGTQLLAFAEQQGIGIRGFSGSGNESMIAIEDYLEGFEVDELTRTVILYVESLKNSRRFFQSACRICPVKPVVLLKGGQTGVGKKAAASHTGALMSDTRVFNAMCRQSGIIKVEQPMELLDLAAAFSSLPLPKGPRVAIMTLGGGWGVVTADLCQSNNLSVPDLDRGVIEALDKLLPPYWSRANPVDLVGEQDPDLPIQALEALVAWDGCDAVINLGIIGRRVFLQRLAKAVLKSDPQSDRTLLDQLGSMLNDFENTFIHHSVTLMEKYGKPVIGVHLLTDGLDKTLYRVSGSIHKGVFYRTPERAVYALSKMVSYRSFLDRGGPAVLA
jgi:acyl-CoA synthetase (NDP forming)